MSDTLPETPLGLLRHMRRAGIQLYVDGEALKVRKATAHLLTDALRAAITTHRTALLMRLAWEQHAVKYQQAQQCSACHAVDWPYPLPESVRLWLWQQLAAGVPEMELLPKLCMTCDPALAHQVGAMRAYWNPRAEKDPAALPPSRSRGEAEGAAGA